MIEIAALVRQARCARQVAHPDPAAILVVGEVPHVVQAVLDVPVVADPHRQLRGRGLLRRQRGQRVAHFGAGLAGLEHMPLALDADGLLAAVQGGIAVPVRVAEILDPVAAAVAAAVLFVEGLVAGTILEQHVLEVVQQRRLVLLDGRDQVVSRAVLEQAARRLVLDVQRVEGDDAPGQVQLPGPLAHGRDRVGLGVDLDLSQHQAAGVLHGRDQHATAVRRLLGGAADILPVHREARQEPWPRGLPGLLLRSRILLIQRDWLALLPRPRRHRVRQCLRRQGGQDVVERRARRGRVAVPAGTVETAHRRALRRV